MPPISAKYDLKVSLASLYWGLVQLPLLVQLWELLRAWTKVVGSVYWEILVLSEQNEVQDPLPS